VTGCQLFDAAIGWCAIAWGEQGVVGVQLPERTPAATLARLRRRLPAALPTALPKALPKAEERPPPPEVSTTIDAIVRLLAGEHVDLGHVVLDMRGVPAFHRRVYEVAREIPAGSTMTYGEVAAHVGEPGAARAVGQALGRNPFPIVVPCHRVLAAGGKPGGFSGGDGVATKLRMLTIEGARPAPHPTLFDSGSPSQPSGGPTVDAAGPKAST
jgi:methylated-DNA-[protein]-cysteine S-methyltransferase